MIRIIQKSPFIYNELPMTWLTPYVYFSTKVVKMNILTKRTNDEKFINDILT